MAQALYCREFFECIIAAFLLDKRLRDRYNKASIKHYK